MQHERGYRDIRERLVGLGIPIEAVGERHRASFPVMEECSLAFCLPSAHGCGSKARIQAAGETERWRQQAESRSVAWVPGGIQRGDIAAQAGTDQQAGLHRVCEIAHERQLS